MLISGLVEVLLKMGILFSLLLLQLIAATTALLLQRKWVWYACLMSNILIHNAILLMIMLFNKLFIGYQNIFEIKISLISKNYLLLFGYDGISILFI